MTSRSWSPAGTLATAVVALLMAGCDASDAHEPRSVAELRARVAADSAAGDSAALAALPPRLQELLRVEPYLTEAHLAATPEAECRTDGPGVDGGRADGDGAREMLGAVAANTERRRVRTPLPDGSHLTVTVRAPADGATLDRVEIILRSESGEPRGWIWDGARDLTVEARWPSQMRGRTERAPQPRGGPVPRAVRALGRLVLGIDCETTPESGSAESDTPDELSARESMADDHRDGPPAP